MNLPIRPARFLLPQQGIDLQKWAVIACDQHTSDLTYWESLSALVGDAPSTLNLIFPEVYLGKDEQSRTERIIHTMNAYLSAGILCQHEGMVAISRTVSNHKVRRGILLCIDLEDYSFVKGENPLIRASEGTVLERIPPRVRVRNRCSLELPHIMLLYDDPQFLVQKAVEASKKAALLYDFDLNMDGGHIRGEKIEDCGKVLDAFATLLNESKARLGEDFLFAVGDGNHSLAAAKQVYEDAKKSGSGAHCRYALCEAVNLYDEALQFEPIHRLVLAGKASEQFLSELSQQMPADPIAAVAFVDEYARKQGFEVDFIHGTDHLAKLAQKLGGAAVQLKPIDKSGFFPYVVQNGSLPKKTFSMGEAQDKRYYLEAARI